MHLPDQLIHLVKIMTLTKDPSQRSSKQVNPKKNKTRKKSLVKPPKIQLLDGDKELIEKYLEDNKHLAVPSKTEAITTKGILQAIGHDAENKDLQNQVTTILKLWGWKKSTNQKTINGKRQYFWINRSLLLNPTTEVKKEGVKQKPQTIEAHGLSLPTQPPNQGDKSDKLNGGLSSSTKPSNSNSYSSTQPPQICHQTKSAKIFLATEPEIEDEIVNGYLRYGEEDIEQVKRILLFVEEEDLGDEDFTGVFAQWERELGLGLFEKACELLPIETVNKLREWVPQVKAVAKERKPLVKTKVTKNIVDADIEINEERIAFTCDIAGIPLEAGDKVWLHSESLTDRLIGEVVEIGGCEGGIKLVVHWEDGRYADYFGEDRVKTTGSYFV